ncbi:MAG: hypothetical protein M1816_002401 [Peltula sp. TS41687]|nr:MAG: hypothetical protein M1816_002401 [Peltula sp. TS41687]
MVDESNGQKYPTSTTIRLKDECAAPGTEPKCTWMLAKGWDSSPGLLLSTVEVTIKKPQSSANVDIKASTSRTPLA